MHEDIHVGGVMNKQSVTIMQLETAQMGGNEDPPTLTRYIHRVFDAVLR